MSASVREIDVVRVTPLGRASGRDALAVEEPLEIRIAWQPSRPLAATPPEKSLSITMRTPGHDVELAVGFLVGEGLVRTREDVIAAAHCGPAVREDGTSNIVKVRLRAEGAIDVARLERHFYTTSSCGVCGKTSLDAVRTNDPPPLPELDRPVSAAVVHRLPAELRAAQEVFERTGGLHAAALFDEAGTLLSIREDVGRHNAVDKLLGAELLAPPRARPARILFVSGRASFELVQKGLMSAVPILAAVGAPSSLAVELAEAHGMTVLGFVRDGRFNAYSASHRLEATAEDRRSA